MRDRAVPSFTLEGLKQRLAKMERDIADLHRRGGWQYDQEVDELGGATGTAEMANAALTATVAHGLGVRPETILVTPRSSATLFVSDRTTTQFTVERASTGGLIRFDWFATGSETVEVLPGSETFSFTGAYEEFVVPDGVATITVDAYGAAGGDEYAPVGNIGLGGRVQCDVTVTPGETLRVYVGGAGGNGASGVNGAAGWNGGGSGGPGAGGGGGSSDVRRSPYALADRLVVAPGGGGSGGNNGATTTGGGGDGRAATGENGQNGISGPVGGTGGTQLGAGTASGGGANGGLGVGGAGSAVSNPRGGGGGGSGYYGAGGGGGGGAGTAGAGGGGGSGLSTGVNATTQDGVRSGNGEVTISWA